MNKEKLERNEEKYFKKWLAQIYAQYMRDRLNYFEHNIEVWRQLWRVVERSDVIVVVTDARIPLLHVPPSLYKYVAEQAGLPMVIVLNKIDLVPKQVLESWVAYFKNEFPNVHVVIFSSFPNYQKVKTSGIDDARLDLYITDLDKVTLGSEAVVSTEKLESRAKRKYVAVGGPELIAACLAIPPIAAKHKTVLERNDGYITIGFIGHPNVGKSSLINGLMGKKVVSTSISPGHTKHLQTIFYKPDICLCDCPGLTFPAIDMPKPLQVVAGLFPIAHVRELYTSVGYLAKYLPLEDIYALDKSYADRDGNWTAWGLSQAMAQKKGFETQGGAWDTHRAANFILKDAVGGILPLFFHPPVQTKGEEKVQTEDDPDWEVAEPESSDTDLKAQETENNDDPEEQTET
eukprot:TRINITY_DN7537_c0_g1_i1.p1 TRINITY_DN7537_c0_g1~~TRINITY_DN7537_c0_g1_i1.p1  ORF type:complete len:412 (-),score=68.66 TRINITY_DN7537_c0_g1_i1:647-1855(-)